MHRKAARGRKMESFILRGGTTGVTMRRGLGDGSSVSVLEMKGERAQEINIPLERTFL